MRDATRCLGSASKSSAAIEPPKLAIMMPPLLLRNRPFKHNASSLFDSQRHKLLESYCRRLFAAMIPPFETTFAVPLSCEDCIKDVSTSLYKVNGMIG
jgi:hypothetical protein